ncbi:MAG: hypothetical protein RL102_448 [Actinomycetota bacterium]|jgi:hypothetical protein
MRSLGKYLAVVALVSSSLLLSGCSADTTDTAANASPAPSIAPLNTEAPTNKPTSDPNQQVSLIDEPSFVAAMKPMGFSCDASVIKAIEFSGTSVEFSSISCRRGSEADVVLTLAADQNELELLNLQSCKTVTGTQLRSPILVGGNWQMLSVASNRPLLEQLGRNLSGKTLTIADVCA